MASNFINVSGLTYCGAEAQEIFSKDIYDIDLRQYGITFMDGVKEIGRASCRERV